MFRPATQLSGGFLVFASLILPALAASSVSQHRLGLTYVIGLAGYALGLLASFVLDLPAGAAIKCALALAVSAVAGIAQVAGLRAVR